ncbi:hypothetical protein VMCG_08115 [Cytospora schulzeri]|uniref:Uncharacterized protein n=1 Tax=Cytospora schulzeri TaxID=448051 RepID=A0A423VRP3_9PEZI|nr:hypothetical protein VMCG_08115 [Valsa malicola]
MRVTVTKPVQDCMARPYLYLLVFLFNSKTSVERWSSQAHRHTQSLPALMDHISLRRLSRNSLNTTCVEDNEVLKHIDEPSSEKASPITASEGIGIVEDLESSPASPVHVEKVRPSRQSYYYSAGSALLVALPFVFLAIWQACTGPITFSTHLTPHIIGGRFTQTEAKTIDFLCSAILGPLLLVALNWYWFSITKVTIVSDSSTEATPLMALVQASYTDSGSYNPRKLFTFIRTGRVKMLLFGLLVLLSAVAQTCFSNFIAYEAYDVLDAKATELSLRSLLTGLDGVTRRTPQTLPMFPPGYDFSSTQVADFVGDATSVLSNIAYQDATKHLPNDTYVGLNVTQNSLDAVDSKIDRLEGVPGYRMMVDCQATPPANLMAEDFSGSSVMINCNAGDNNNYFTASYPGQMSILTSGEDDSIYPWVGFHGWEQAYLGNMMASNWSRFVTPSSYGNITIAAFNMTRFGFSGDKTIMSAFGFACNVSRDTGSVNLTRGSDSTWTREAESWSGETSPVKLLISDWQLALNYHSPVDIGGMPGLGQPLQDTAWPGESYWGTNGITLDARINMLNYLYAVGEVERLAYETKNANASLDDGTTSYAQIVRALGSEQAYRIVYVPIILLIGLICVSVEALITFCLLVTDIKRGTASVKTWQQVGIVQLLADSIKGLRHDPVVENMYQAKGTGADKIARHYKVRYEALPGKRNVLRADSPTTEM